VSERLSPNGGLEIERNGGIVTLTVRFKDEYEAIKLYDECVASARAGWLQIDLTLKEPT
jgi:hypothetical protein